MTVETSTHQASDAPSTQEPNASPQPPADLTTAELRAQIEQLQQQNTQLRVQEENLRQNVRAVAQRYARANNWCSEVNNALDEIGIPYATTVTFDAVIRVNMQADLITSDEGDLPSFLQNSLEVCGVDYEDVRLRLDSDDWRDINIEDATLERIENITV
ncbi:hypothetical protein [Kineococcus rhizosphaerae]|uniref:Uncharacterized protein n=1 Tax=Kineococcus rhizosphaerae TaxID=559628 RepID=A0A2T0QMI8_9ACTN|nr:hypothetical protein [Kineococcus rhizosphaerae]PRY05748.1 hypothetical protein CLV37_1379 [Kineococcus rhizosphaerae]